MSLKHIGKPEIMEAGLCQKNLRANLKKLQVIKDGSVCTSIKLTTGRGRKGNCNGLNRIKYAYSH